MEENEAKKAKEDAEKEKRRMREHKQMADHRATQVSLSVQRHVVDIFWSSMILSKKRY